MTLKLKIIAGLGNPGKKYEHTRHNAGFMIIDELYRRWSAGSPSEKFSSIVAEACYTATDGTRHNLFLVKPQTFMNLSGDAVRAIAEFYKITKENILIVHDEVDLPFERIRIKFGGGDGGHNGLRSLGQQLGGQNFYRLRFGVGRPPPEHQIDLADWVLARFSATESAKLPEMIAQSCAAVETLLTSGFEVAQRQFNRS